MPKSIDVKSAIVGGLAVALVICSIGAVRHASSYEYGRFEMACNSGHAFILDTASGQVWSQSFPEGVITAPHTLLEFYDPKTYDLSDPDDPNSLIR